MNATIGKTIYFIIQTLRKEPVLSVLRELEASQWFSRDELQNLQFLKMKKIIRFAYDKVPFYKKLYDQKGITPDDIKDHAQVRFLPIVDRAMIQSNLHELIGRNSSYYPARTAGTTGQSLKLLVDNLSWAYHHANILRTLSWFDVEPKAPEARIWGRRIDSSAYVKMFLKDFLFNRVRMNAFDIEREAIPFAKKLIRFKPHYIYGYPSAIAQFVEQLKNWDIKIPFLKVVACSAEQLSTSQRQYIEDFFKTKTTNIYGAAEVGIIASKCPEDNWHIPVESIYVDIENEEKLLGDQKTGEIIVTDLNNYTMPIIRYSIGDLGFLTSDSCPCGRGLPLLGDFQGRKLEFIETKDGRKVNSVITYYLFKALEARGAKVKQYQLVQEQENYFSINVISQEPLRHSDKKYLIETLKYYLGEEIEVIVKEVNCIPPSMSGKHEIFIKNFNEL